MPSPEHVRLRLMLLGQRRDVVGHRCATDSLRHTPSQWDRKEQLRGVSDSEEEAISRPHPYMGYVRLGCQLKPGDRRFCWSRADLWAWLDLDQRPHPYQLNAGNRCADRPFPRSRPTVRAEGMRSIRPLVCVHPFHPAAGGIAASSTSYSACNSLIECTRECGQHSVALPTLDWHAPSLASIGIVRLVARLRSVCRLQATVPTAQAHMETNY